MAGGGGDVLVCRLVLQRGRAGPGLTLTAQPLLQQPLYPRRLQGPEYLPPGCCVSR